MGLLIVLNKKNKIFALVLLSVMAFWFVKKYCFYSTKCTRRYEIV